MRIRLRSKSFLGTGAYIVLTWSLQLKTGLKIKIQTLNSCPCPLVFGRPEAEVEQEAYYLARNLNILGETHAAMFKAVNEQGLKFTTLNDVVIFYAKVLNIQVPTLEARIKQAHADVGLADLAKKADLHGMYFRIKGTPSLVVDGTYLVTPEANPFPDVDDLLRKVKTERTAILKAEEKVSKN